MKITKYAAAGAAVALMMAPAFAAAEDATTTANPLSSQIQSLMSQIQALQNQLKTLLSQAGSSTKPMMGEIGGMMSGGMGMMNPGQMGKMVCITLNRNLKPGMQGDDVKNVQQMLKSDPDSGFSGEATGFFGQMTAKAMAKFQMKNGIASSSDGAVGPMTRGFFQRACGNGLGGGMGQGMEQRGEMNVMMIVGKITASSASSITVQGPNNESKTFAINASTTIEVKASTTSPATAGTTADLVVGKTAMIQATKLDGNPVATHIRVGDVPMPPMGGQGGPNGMMMTKPMWEQQQGQGGQGGGPGWGMGGQGGPNMY